MTRNLKVAVLLTAAGVYLLLLSEWLFFVTKPSMFTGMGWTEKVGILLCAALAAALGAMLVALLFALAGFAKPNQPVLAAVTALAGHLVPATVLSLTVFLLVENFTKTVLGFNVGSVPSGVRFLYAGGLVALLVWFTHRLGRIGSRPASRGDRVAAVGVLALLAVSALAAPFRYERAPGPEPVEWRSEQRPVNILLFSSDGVEAQRMSVYGGARETTPFLNSRVDEFLVSENHFTNAATTAGSTGALLSGKLPTTTGVTQASDIFQGEHVYQHLPGLLRQLGYHNIEIGLRSQTDAQDRNMLRSFHVTNSRRRVAEHLPLVAWFVDSFQSEQFFLSLTLDRIRERLAHVLGIAVMRDTHAVVTGKRAPWLLDQDRISTLKDEIDRAPRPFFAQVHLMGTHGDIFDPTRRHFSAGKEQTSKWDLDFLDDAILDFDDYIRDVVLYLEETGELDNVILAINSDHGIEWSTAERLPLLMRFPKAQHRGRLTVNTQRVDVAPTVLSYLGLQPPEWLDGRSLIDTETDRLRPILATGFKRRGPFLPTLSLVQCQRWSEFNLDSGIVEEREIAGHTATCPEAEMLTSEETRQYLLTRLADSGRLPAPLLLGERLARLPTSQDPAERKRVTKAILDSRGVGMIARRLDNEMTVARVHWDFWTYSTGFAGLVVRNRGREPLSRRITVQTGRGREFPVHFHVEDGESRHDYVVERPGTVEVQLAPVEARSARLFIIWSDQAFAEGDRRRLGVRLAVSLGDKLDRLTQQDDAAERQRVAGEILEEKVSVHWLAERMPVAGVYWDAWTRGTQPAGLVVRNDGEEPLTKKLAVDSGAGGEFPARLYVEDGEKTHEYVLAEPGRVVVELPAVAPESERLYVVWTDRAWTPGTADKRQLGIRLAEG